MIETITICHCDKCGRKVEGDYFYRIAKEKMQTRSLSQATIPMIYSDGIIYNDPWRQAMHVCSECTQEIFKCCQH